MSFNYIAYLSILPTYLLLYGLLNNVFTFHLIIVLLHKCMHLGYCTIKAKIRSVQYFVIKYYNFESWPVHISINQVNDTIGFVYIFFAARLVICRNNLLFLTNTPLKGSDLRVHKISSHTHYTVKVGIIQLYI